MAETIEPQLDEDGLVIQTYDSMVLVVVPPEGFGDQILRYARSSLYNVSVGTRSVAQDPDTDVKGRLQDEFLVDGPLAGESMDAYTGIVIAGCEGPNPLANDGQVQTLLRAAHADGKLIAAWGNGLEALAAAGVVKGRKVTGDVSAESATKSAGGKYTGRQLEVSNHLVTAVDEGSGMRFGQALAEVVRI
jgi:putative intracellular protease/amidase